MFDLLPPPQDVAAPPWDLTVGLINATVQIDQSNDDGTRRMGTGFLIDAPLPDGQPRTVLVTAAHVLDGMAKPEARIGWRVQMPEGRWQFAPEPVRIRSEEGQAVWTRHPDRDIAVMEVSAPPAFARAAIPLDWLADRLAFERWQVGPGDEMLTLGYPHGYSANTAGFAILKTGRIASWPLTPIDAFPSFLLDFAVFPGNSGGPVFWVPSARRTSATAVPDHPYIAGILAQEMRVRGESTGIGFVLHAAYIREALALLDQPASTSADIRSSSAPP